jgi:hypothetical protein
LKLEEPSKYFEMKDIRIMAHRKIVGKIFKYLHKQNNDAIAYKIKNIYKHCTVGPTEFIDIQALVLY